MAGSMFSGKSNKEDGVALYPIASANSKDAYKLASSDEQFNALAAEIFKFLAPSASGKSLPSLSFPVKRLNIGGFPSGHKPGCPVAFN